MASAEQQTQGPQRLSFLPSRLQIHRLQIHQYNDSEILEFFIRHAVEYDLVGDHLFIIHGRKSDVAAGLGDWLVARPDGEVDVERGDYALRAHRAMTRPRKARHERVQKDDERLADLRIDLRPPKHDAAVS